MFVVSLQGTVPLDLRIRRMRLPAMKTVSQLRLASSPLFPSYSRNVHTGNNLDLGNAVGVAQDDANLRRSGTLSGELGDLLDDLLGGGLQPCRRGARVGERGGGNALALAVKTAHVDGVVVVLRVRSCCSVGRKVARSRRGCVELEIFA